MSMDRDAIMRALRCKASAQECSACPIWREAGDCTPCLTEYQGEAARLIEALEARVRELEVEHADR